MKTLIEKIVRFMFPSLFKRLARNEQNIKALSRAVTQLYYTNNKSYIRG